MMPTPMNIPSVSVWKETLTLPTYPVKAPDPNPMFFEKRNIQGSKGNIYPNPFIDQLSDEAVDCEYDAIILENEYLRIILIPELGGRIFAGLDKTNQYDFFYRHKVIKPALIGLFGPWISGGVEFNWPQHHRPSTFMPVDYVIEKHDDGSQTVWMGEHDPMNRTKGMVGICLSPGKALIETKVRLYNRTPLPQSFLWWQNAAVHINGHYQVIFPPDVHYAQFHYKQSVVSYPIAKGPYSWGLDYGDGTDVSWYANTPIMTSFFAGESKYDFFGGYDHARDAGVVHVANHHISPGKKFFTWSNGTAGHRWQRNLMDDGREYLELMAGVYTDNQPDFSWIMPYETKTFSQFWYPIQKIGPMKNANTYAAVNLEMKDGSVHLGIYATQEYEQALVLLTQSDNIVLRQRVDLAPGEPYCKVLPLPDEVTEAELLLQVQTAESDEIIRYAPEKPWDGKMPAPYQPPGSPEDMESIEELYLTGLHLEQYRHPVIDPEPYWQEALRRDPGDSRCNVALGRRLLRRGLFTQAEEHFRMAVKRITRYNPNPYDGEAYYNLGLVLKYQNRLNDAYDAFYKAIWNAAYRSSGYYASAQVDCIRHDYAKALEHLDRALQTNTQHLQARNLKAAVLRKLMQYDAAEVLVAETGAEDVLDFWSRYERILLARAKDEGDVADKKLVELQQLLRGNVQTSLDLALDYVNAGMWSEAFGILNNLARHEALHPMVAYALGYCNREPDADHQKQSWYAKGAQAAPDYCFPFRLEEMLILQDVLAVQPEDARAHYYLGNLLYDKRRYAEAVALWKESVRLDPNFSIPWRNLALAAYNLDRDIEAAEEYFEKALAVNPHDARLLFEFDQLLKRKPASPEDRLKRLEQHLDLVKQRDALTLEMVKLYNCLGQPEKALEIMSVETFHPWEGGEGMAAEQYMQAHWQLGRQSLDAGDAASALKHFEAGLCFPESLGEIPYDMRTVHLHHYRGLAYELSGQKEDAQQAFEDVLAIQNLLEISPVAYYQALALLKLGKTEEGQQKLQILLAKASELLEAEPNPYNYFGMGLPSPVFEDDVRTLNTINGNYLIGLARLGLGEKGEAREAFELVLTLDPSHPSAREELKRL